MIGLGRALTRLAGKHAVDDDSILHIAVGDDFRSTTAPHASARLRSDLVDIACRVVWARTLVGPLGAALRADGGRHRSDWRPAS